MISGGIFDKTKADNEDGCRLIVILVATFFLLPAIAYDDEANLSNIPAIPEVRNNISVCLSHLNSLST